MKKRNGTIATCSPVEFFCTHQSLPDNEHGGNESMLDSIDLLSHPPACDDIPLISLRFPFCAPSGTIVCSLIYYVVHPPIVFATQGTFQDRNNSMPGSLVDLLVFGPCFANSRI